MLMKIICKRYNRDANEDVDVRDTIEMLMKIICKRYNRDANEDVEVRDTI